MFRIVSLSVLLTLIVVLGITFFKVVAPFLLPLFLAGVVAILAQPLFKHFVKRTKGRVRLASGITTSVIMTAILLPLIVATALASLQLYAFALQVGDGESWKSVLGGASSTSVDGEESGKAESLEVTFANFANRFLPDDNPVNPDRLRDEVAGWLEDNLNELGDRTLGLVKNALFSVVSFILALLIFAVALYYFFADGTELLQSTENLIPVHVDYQREMLNQFATVVRSVVSATFFAGLAQAIATTLALWVAGFDHLLVLFVLCLLASLIPMAGAWLVWAPCAVILVQQGHHFGAVLLAIYGLAFVGMLDNIVRTYVLNNSAKLHPLLALISVLGGIQVMGLWGVFIGPIVASCLHALVKIFNHELVELSKETFSTAKGSEGKKPVGQLKSELSPVAISSGPQESSESNDEVRPVAINVDLKKRGDSAAD